MKIHSVLLSCIVTMSCTVACDTTEKSASAADYAGEYAGYTLASCAYFQNSLSDGETVSLSLNSDGTFRVSLVSETWGEFTIDNALASLGDSSCTLTGSGQTLMGMGGSTSTYDCTFTAEIQSLTDARMTFEIPSVMGGMTLLFRTGDAPANLLLAGTYEGYTNASSAYFQDMYTDGESVVLTANGDGTLKVVFESATWGTFTVESASATNDGEEYVFTGSGSVAMGMGDSTSDYDFTLSGRSNADKDDFAIAFNVPAVMGGLTVTLLPGTAPASEE